MKPLRYLDIEVKSRPWLNKTWTRWTLRVRGTTVTADQGGTDLGEEVAREIAERFGRKLERVIVACVNAEKKRAAAKGSS